MKNDALSLMLTDKMWPEARDILQKRYERVAKRSEQVTSDDVFEDFMERVRPRVRPPLELFLAAQFRGIPHPDESLLRGHRRVAADDRRLRDGHGHLPGGSAQTTGELKTNDRILAVGQSKSGEMVDVVGWRLDDVVQLIRGPQGSFVRLNIQPANAPPGTQEHLITRPAPRSRLEAQAAKKELRKVTRDGKEMRIGVITVPSFYQDYNARPRATTTTAARRATSAS